MKSLLHRLFRTPLAQGAVLYWLDQEQRKRGKATPRRLAKTYFGATMACDTQDYIGKRIFLFGIWEPNISKAIEGVLKPGDTFVDVGANIGYDTLLACSRVGPAGKVIAIEASPVTFERLKENLALNDAGQVRTVNKAAGAEAGLLKLYGGDDANAGRTSPFARAGLALEATVEMLPLDQILTEEERKVVRLIKIDIEGGELAVLNRLVQTLDLYGPNLSVIVEMSPEEGGEALVQAFNALVAAGFEAYAVDNPYVWQTYVFERILPPQRITGSPQAQTDVLFTRAPLASAS